MREAEALGLTLMLDHTFVYTPTVQHLRHLVRGGEIGTVQYLDSVRVNLGLVQPDVDVFWDLAPHDLSIFDAILPDGVHVARVAAHGSDPIGAGRACVGHLTLELSDGVLAHVHVNWLSPTKIRTMIVGGSRRTVVWDDLNAVQRLSVHDRGADRIEDDEDRHQAIISYRRGDTVALMLTTRSEFHLVDTALLQTLGLEWLHRVAQEPRRLWPRWYARRAESRASRGSCRTTATRWSSLTSVVK